jgi:uncharacterized protein (TIGR02145 family)
MYQKFWIALIYLVLGTPVLWAQSAKFYGGGLVYRYMIPTQVDSLLPRGGNFEVHTKRKGYYGVYHDSDWIRVDSVRFSLDHGQMIDPRDSALYQTIRIGDKVWFAENLRFGKFIPMSQNPKVRDTVEKYCPSNQADSCAKYGALYWWSEAMQVPDSCDQTGCAALIQKQHRGICPVGWHIPNRNEWKQLNDLIGANAGQRMKKLYGSSWDQGAYNDSNSSGFGALPTGYVWSKSQSALGTSAHFWAAGDTGSSGLALGYTLEASSTSLNFNDGDWKTTGEAIRCVQDSAVSVPGVLLDVRDSQTYATATFGDREWMTENLNLGQMQSITLYKPFTQQYNAANPKLSHKACYNNDLAKCDTLGALYQWQVAMALPASCQTSSCDSLIQKPYHQGLCPSGWHVPSPEDFSALVTFVGGAQIAGKRLGDTTGFHSQNSGWLFDYGSFTRSGAPEYSFEARYWSSRQERKSWGYESTIMSVDTSDPVVGLGTQIAQHGQSLRCVKNPVP